ncbi:MAG: hypothetical protein C5B60_07870 [Chloroflexi bacterium]|nr:MAG: hypothetical protein C5B60_07870 [Chloroflexota bacterium]
MIPDTNNMSVQQLYGMVQVMLGPLVGWLVAQGMDNATAGLVAGAVAMLISVAWSVMMHRKTSQAAAVAATPGVKVVVDKTAPLVLHQLATDPNHPDIVHSDLKQRPSASGGGTFNAEVRRGGASGGGSSLR